MYSYTARLPFFFFSEKLGMHTSTSGHNKTERREKLSFSFSGKRTHTHTYKAGK